VSGKKQRDQAKADAEIRKQREKEAAKGDGGKEQDNEAEATDVLGVNEDDDVIF
jgi:V-type H+-transporting ATPase subunit D